MQESTFKILVPTDFSNEAQAALDTAVQLLKKGAANELVGEITLMHVLNLPANSKVPLTETTCLDALVYIEKKNPLFPLDELNIVCHKIQALKNQYPDMLINDKVVLDPFVREIAELVSPQWADLIVMGSKGASGIKEVVIGSNTEKVIRLSRIPVLTVKGKVSFPIQDIVFASDFKNVPTKVIHQLKFFQDFFNVKIHLLRVLKLSASLKKENHEDIETNMHDFAAKEKLGNYSVNAYYHPVLEEGIREFADFIEAELIMMSTHGRTGLAHFFKGSIAESVANHSVKPVLTFQENEG